MDFKVIEGVGHIESFYFLRADPFRKTAFIVLSILSLGLFGLLLYWMEDLRHKMYRKTNNYEKASVVVLITDSNQKIYCDLVHVHTKLFREDQPKKHLTFKIGLYHYYFDANDQKFYVVGKAFIKDLEARLQVKKNYLKDYQPLSESEAQELIQHQGPNQIYLEPVNIPYEILKHLLLPLNIYEMILIAVCIHFKIYLWGVQLSIYIVVQIFVAILGKLEKVNGVNQLNGVTRSVNVIRKNKNGQKSLVEIPDSQLAVGDIIKIQEGQKINCDVLVLSGTCLVDQAVLTGETVPVSKTELPLMRSKIQDKNLLYSGSDCLIIQSPIVWGLVIGTGWNTLKGSLIGDIVKSKGKQFRFDKDFFIVCTIAAIIYIAINLFLVYHDLVLNVFTWRMSLIRFVVVITSALPPSLFFAFILSTFTIKRRLKTKHINCLNAEKLKEVGRVGIIAFDKTGTLTEDSIQVCGFMLKENDKNAFSEFSENLTDTLSSKYYRETNETMACCNDLHIVNQKVVGDPIDLQMYHQSNFKLNKGEAETKSKIAASSVISEEDEEDIEDSKDEELKEEKKGSKKLLSKQKELKKPVSLSRVLYPEIPVITEEMKRKFEVSFTPSREFIRMFHLHHSDKYSIHKKFEFTPERKRMSVIVARPQGSNSVSSSNPVKRNHVDYLLYCKGAPEIVKTICNPNSIPEDFDAKLIEFSEKGFRVIALACKSINENEIESTEEALETNLNFLGLVFMINPLKAKTAPTIAQLQENRVDCLMVTGDNIYTGVNVSLGSGIIQDGTKIFIGTKGKDDILWTFVSENNRLKMHNHHLQEISENSQHPSLASQSMLVDHKSMIKTYKTKHYSTDIEAIVKLCDIQDCCIALEGDAFDHLLTKYDPKSEVMIKVLKKTKVYGRTKPDQKQRVVNMLKDLYDSKHITVGFVGDGSNDCKALSAANMGLSIGSNDSSIAASFSSDISDISPVIELLIEGRFTLENLIQIFKVSMYGGFAESVSLIYVFYMLQIPTYFDNFINVAYYLPIYLLVSGSAPREKLNPFRPKPGFLDFKSLIPFLVMIVMSTVYSTFIYAMISNRPEYKPVEAVVEDWRHIDYNDHYFIEYKMLGTSFVINYLIIVTIFHRGYPFKQPVFKNWPLLVYVCVLIGINLFPYYTSHFHHHELESIANKYINTPNVTSQLLSSVIWFSLLFTTFMALLLLVIEDFLLEKSVIKFMGHKNQSSQLEIIDKPIEKTRSH